METLIESVIDLGMERVMERPQYLTVGFENNNVQEQDARENTI